ncbi:hypothetical protein [Geobacillus sp. FSL W8-1251]|uniref:hypothetical protein n=1 Tax=Geobacillus sp. FSL W8-1251 TaxID=2954650 RepID=UPI0030FBA783
MKQVVVRSSVTPWRDGASHRLAFDSRKWTNRFSVKDMLNFFVASIYFDYWAVEGNQTNPSDLKVYGYAGTMVEEVANYRGHTFIDITPVPKPDQPLKINEVFPDENLAKYFAEWMSALPSWQGKSDSTFSMAELDARIKLNGALNFNASNRGIRSLKGMEIFGDVATKYSDIPVNFNFSGNLLEDVDPLYKITSVRTLL